jgi:uncharacterized protein YfaS (alpha-2-macroglobulin family)
MPLSETLSNNQCALLLEETSELELQDLDVQLPSDVHLVVTDKGIYGVRAYKASDIFDSFHDEGHIVTEIRSGFGRIRPNLFKGLEDRA